MMIEFSNSFGSNTSFYDINNKKEQSQSFLENKGKGFIKRKTQNQKKMRGPCPH